VARRIELAGCDGGQVDRNDGRSIVGGVALSRVLDRSPHSPWFSVPSPRGEARWCHDDRCGRWGPCDRVTV
jgi:hypothetical protein